MTKYFCDICGKEVKSVAKYLIPEWGNKDMKDKNGAIIKRFFVTVPEEKDLCRQCANSIHQLIRIYQVALTNDEKIITITFPKQDDEVTE